MTQYVIIAKRNIWRGRKNHARSRIKENISRKEKGTFMSKVRRVYVEKKLAFAVKAKELQAEIKSYLGISSVTGVRELIRYDIDFRGDLQEGTGHCFFRAAGRYGFRGNLRTWQCKNFFCRIFTGTV